MASIQQLLRRSQQDRTQVAGPLSNAPKLQATITAGAGGPVQVKQAGKNKWQHLAEGLSTINPALREFTEAQKLEAEMFAREQSGRKPEDVLADLKKEAEPFNKLTRKGGLPFLGNPFAVMQNKRTIGQIAAGAFKGQLENALETAPINESPEQTLTRVRQEFEQEHPRLVDENGHPAIGVGDGFQTELNSYLPSVLRSSERLRNAKAKAQNRLVTGEQLYQVWEDYNDGTLTGDEFKTKRNTLWEFNTASDTPSEQIAILKSVAQTIARSGSNSEEAYNKAMLFVQDAVGDLKIGNAKAGSKVKIKDDGDRVFDEFTDFGGTRSDLMADLESIRDARERGEDDEEEDLKKKIVPELYDKILAWQKQFTPGQTPTAQEQQNFSMSLMEEFSAESDLHKTIVPRLVREQMAVQVEFPKDDFYKTLYEGFALGNPFAANKAAQKEVIDRNIDDTIDDDIDVSGKMAEQDESLKQEIITLVEDMQDGSYTIELGGKEVTRERVDKSTQASDLQRWTSEAVGKNKKELEDLINDRKTVKEAVTEAGASRIKPEDRKSFIASDDSPIGKNDSRFFVSPHNVERFIQDGDGANAKKEAEKLLRDEDRPGDFGFDARDSKNNGISRIMSAIYGSKSPLELWYEKKIKNASETARAPHNKASWRRSWEQEKKHRNIGQLNPDEARRKLLVTLLGAQKLNESSILSGEISFKWGKDGKREETFEIKNMEAVASFAKSYPVMSVDAVTTFRKAYEAWGKSVGDEDAPLPNEFPFTTYKEVFKKLHGVENMMDEDLRDFMEQQYRLHKIFKNIQ